MFYFPWGETVVDLRFWQCLLGHGDFSLGWLRDEVRITVNYNISSLDLFGYCLNFVFK